MVVLAEPLKVYGYDLDFRLQPNGEGHYHQFLAAIGEQGVVVDLDIVSLQRGLRYMEEEADACNFPATINAIMQSYPAFADIPLIAGEPVDHISLRVFTRPGEPVVSDMAELKGRRVALWNGLDPEALLRGAGALVEPTPNESVRVRMLAAGRMDVIIGFMPDVLLVAEAQGIPVPHYAESLALYLDEGATIVCRDTASNREQLAAFNVALNALKRSGELQRILGPFADIAE
ncbi:MAG: transporter substrate-binding domain-containing protein [Saccharospirillum sp.]|nr:transporter substrate-binding domain-containing protein [Saccharospirillum sp.]